MDFEELGVIDFSSHALEVSESPEPLSPVSCQGKADPSETDRAQPLVPLFLVTHPRLTKQGLKIASLCL